MAISTLNDADPLSELIAPPKDESAADKALRERKEAEAQRVSQRIDEELKAERARMKKERSIVRVLLLGQSHSGKSTTLKRRFSCSYNSQTDSPPDFRMKYAPEEWSRERNAWRAVIQLNLIRSIITIVETLQAEMDGEEIDSIDDSSNRRPSTASSSSASILSVHLTDQHQLLKLRLGPLRRVETDLRRRLGAATEEITASTDSIQPAIRRELELGIRKWRDVVEPMGADGQVHDICLEATDVISACCDDMKALWVDETVRVVLRKHNVNLEDEAGFFLNDLDRIATHGYEPSDDDVVRARLRTLGIQEYRIKFDKRKLLFFRLHVSYIVSGVLPSEFGQEWTIYDVGGSRTVRRAWLPYFEGVNAIIFLAPISCFNESLLEAPNVNRLEDSFIIWRAIISSKLLAKTTMIVFMNKCDLLKKKLRSGIQVKRYVPSYGDRENEVGTVVKFFKDRFKDVAKLHSPMPRATYLYPTCVTDTKATAVTLKTVRDGILREHLQQADLV